MNRSTGDGHDADCRDDSHKDPGTLAREIDETRADLQASLEALEHKWSGEQLVDRTIERVRRHSGEFTGNLGNAIKQNPVPMLLTSIGLAWLMSNGRRYESEAASREPSRVRERWPHAKDAAQHGSEIARERLEQSRDAVSRSADALQARASRAGSAARHGAERTRHGFQRLLEEQPLLLGAIGIAAGAIVGALLPRTEKEDAVLGRASDRTVERAEDIGPAIINQARLCRGARHPRVSSAG